MMHCASHKKAPRDAFTESDSGSASVEFVIIFPIIFLFLIAAVELGMLNLRQTMLERAVDLTVRDLRLGKVADPSHLALKTIICNRASILPDCLNNLRIELRPIDKSTWALPNANAQCVDREEEITPVITLNAGAPEELMLVRACAVLDPIFPTAGLGAAISNNGSGEIFLISTSVFVNEP